MRIGSCRKKPLSKTRKTKKRVASERGAPRQAPRLNVFAFSPLHLVTPSPLHGPGINNENIFRVAPVVRDCRERHGGRFPKRQARCARKDQGGVAQRGAGQAEAAAEAAHFLED